MKKEPEQIKSDEENGSEEQSARRQAAPRPRREIAAMVWPDVLLIGAQKAGSTSLFLSLSRHPHLCPATPTHFFNRDDRYRLGLPFYMAQFNRSRAGSHCHKFIDATPDYLHTRAVPYRIAKEAHATLGSLRSLRLIATLREPMARDASMFSLMRSVNVSFDPWLPRGASVGRFSYGRFVRERIARELRAPGSTSLARGVYARQLLRFVGAGFSPRQTFVLNFDQLVEDAPDMMARIWTFLQLRPASRNASRPGSGSEPGAAGASATVPSAAPPADADALPVANELPAAKEATMHERGVDECRSLRLFYSAPNLDLYALLAAQRARDEAPPTQPPFTYFAAEQCPHDGSTAAHGSGARGGGEGSQQQHARHGAAAAGRAPGAQAGAGLDAFREAAVDAQHRAGLPQTRRRRSGETDRAFAPCSRKLKPNTRVREKPTSTILRMATVPRAADASQPARRGRGAGGAILVHLEGHARGLQPAHQAHAARGRRREHARRDGCGAAGLRRPQLS